MNLFFLSTYPFSSSNLDIIQTPAVHVIIRYKAPSIFAPGHILSAMLNEPAVPNSLSQALFLEKWSFFQSQSHHNQLSTYPLRNRNIS